MKQPENLKKLIEAIESNRNSGSLSDAWLKKHGYYTREDIGIREYTSGIIMVPEEWVLPYLKELYRRLTDMEVNHE